VGIADTDGGTLGDALGIADGFIDVVGT